MTYEELIDLEKMVEKYKLTNLQKILPFGLYTDLTGSYYKFYENNSTLEEVFDFASNNGMYYLSVGTLYYPVSVNIYRSSGLIRQSFNIYLPFKMEGIKSKKLWLESIVISKGTLLRFPFVVKNQTKFEKLQKEVLSDIKRSILKYAPPNIIEALG